MGKKKNKKPNDASIANAVETSAKDIKPEPEDDEMPPLEEKTAVPASVPSTTSVITEAPSSAFTIDEDLDAIATASSTSTSISPPLTQSTSRLLTPSSPISTISTNPDSPRYQQHRSYLLHLQNELKRELDEELKRRKLDVSAIRDLCRTSLQQRLQSNHQHDEDDNYHFSDEVLMEVPLVVPEQRAVVWKALLQCHNKDESIVSSTTELSTVTSSRTITPEQQQHYQQQQTLIHQDVIRTRVDEEMLNKDGMREELEFLLNFYCRSRGVGYKQGLNEILAPLLICMKSSPQTSTIRTDTRGGIFNCMYALINKFLPSIFTDQEFSSLRYILRQFRLLLNYHDPQLSSRMDASFVLPELYATPWFITLFARGLSLSCVFLLWDVYLVEDDPFLHYYTALALLIRNRDVLLAADDNDMPMVLRNLTINRFSSLLTHAKLLRSRTPISFRQQLFEISYKLRDVSILDGFTEKADVRKCMSIPAQEIVHQSHNDLLEGGNLRYMIVDTRPLHHFENGHLPIAFHLDPELLSLSTEKLMDILFVQKNNKFGGLRGCHICFVGRTWTAIDQSISSPESTEPTATTLSDFFDNLLDDDDTDTKTSTPAKQPDTINTNHTTISIPDHATQQFIQLFLACGFPFISVCEGAWPACHRLMNDEGVQSYGHLVDHVPSKCEVCTPGCFNALEQEHERRRTLDHYDDIPTSTHHVHEVDTTFTISTPSTLSPVEIQITPKNTTPTATAEKQSKPITSSSASTTTTTTSTSTSTTGLKSSLLRWGAAISQKLKKVETPTPVGTMELDDDDGKETMKSPNNTTPKTSTTSTTSTSTPTSSKPSTTSISQGSEKRAAILAEKQKVAAELAVKKQQLAATTAKPKAKPQSAPTELNATIDLGEWCKDPTITLFLCHEIRSLKSTNGTKGALLPRILAITPGYIIALQPHDLSIVPLPASSAQEAIAKSTIHTTNASETSTSTSTSISTATTESTSTSTTGSTSTSSSTTETSTTTSEPSTVSTKPSTSTQSSPSSEPSSSPSPSPSPSTASLHVATDNITSPSTYVSPSSDTMLSPVDDAAAVAAAAARLEEKQAAQAKRRPSKPTSITTTETTSISQVTSPRANLTGHAYMKTKRGLLELDRITTKKDKPNIITFHWKGKEGSATPNPTTVIYLMHDTKSAKDCITLARMNFVMMKSSASKLTTFS